MILKYKATCAAVSTCWMARREVDPCLVALSAVQLGVERQTARRGHGAGCSRQRQQGRRALDGQCCASLAAVPIQYSHSPRSSE